MPHCAQRRVFIVLDLVVEDGGDSRYSEAAIRAMVARAFAVLPYERATMPNYWHFDDARPSERGRFSSGSFVRRVILPPRGVCPHAR